MIEKGISYVDQVYPKDTFVTLSEGARRMIQAAFEEGYAAAEQGAREWLGAKHDEFRDAFTLQPPDIDVPKLNQRESAIYHLGRMYGMWQGLWSALCDWETERSVVPENQKTEEVKHD